MKETTSVPNYYFDELMPLLTHVECRVLFVFIREIRGWHKYRTTLSRRISISTIVRLSGVSRRHVRAALRFLQDARIIKMTRVYQKWPNNEACEWRLFCDEEHRWKMLRERAGVEGPIRSLDGGSQNDVCEGPNGTHFQRKVKEIKTKACAARHALVFNVPSGREKELATYTKRKGSFRLDEGRLPTTKAEKMVAWYVRLSRRMGWHLLEGKPVQGATRAGWKPGTLRSWEEMARKFLVKHKGTEKVCKWFEVSRDEFPWWPCRTFRTFCKSYERIEAKYKAWAKENKAPPPPPKVNYDYDEQMDDDKLNSFLESED